MAEAIKEDVVVSPVGTPATGRQATKNKNGFVKGQEVSNKDYFEFIAKQRLVKNAEANK